MTFSAADHSHMAEALRLAGRGLWSTDPNPRVGCVVVRGEEIVGRGWHRRAGEPHAETLALASAGTRARGAVVYVTLEPCNHHGRTPPCTDALVRAGVGEVIVSITDPSAGPAGSGLEALGRAGIRVRCGLMEEAARMLNPGFISRHTRGRPWVRIKLAASLDGRVAAADGSSRWITSSAAREDGHRLRARASAILTGIGTVLADDPRLDVRLPGMDRLPAKVIVDTHARLPADARLLATQGRVLVASTRAQPRALRNVEWLRLAADASGRVSLAELLNELGLREINELHVEAGPTLAGNLLANGLADELVIYHAPCLVGEGLPLVRLPDVENLDQRLHLIPVEMRRIGPDWKSTWRVDR